MLNDHPEALKQVTRRSALPLASKHIVDPSLQLGLDTAGRLAVERRGRRPGLLVSRRQPAPRTGLQPGQACRVYTNETHPESCGFSFGSDKALWNNKGDCGLLYDERGVEAARYCY